MKLAIIHDYLNQYGGAERVIETLHELYPEVPIFTSIYTPDTMPDSFKQMDIRTSFMQRLPFLKKYFKYYLFLYPKAIESLDLSGYDIVLSSSSAFAKGVRTEKGTLHICYCYTPTRFVWDYKNYVRKEKLLKPVAKILQLVIIRLRKWDLETISRVDYFVAISNNIKNKIKKFYNRESLVIYPPVETSIFNIENSDDDYFLVVSRLNSYKNLDLVVKAFNQVDLKLKIVGVGPFRKALEQLAESSNIEFLGKVTDKELVKLYGRCRALIFPGEEDFGITPLEAQASGRPVIAYARGGSLETIIDGKTGILFKDNNPKSLLKAIKKFIEVENSFNKKIIRDNALRFSSEIFKEKIKTFIDKKYSEYKNKNT